MPGFTGFSDDHLRTMRALCDTVVPAIPRDDDPHGFWGRKASDLAVEHIAMFALGAQKPEVHWNPWSSSLQ